jgi:hypothetical protein
MSDQLVVRPEDWSKLQPTEEQKEIFGCSTCDVPRDAPPEQLRTTFSNKTTVSAGMGYAGVNQDPATGRLKSVFGGFQFPPGPPVVSKSLCETTGNALGTRVSTSGVLTGLYGGSIGASYGENGGTSTTICKNIFTTSAGPPVPMVRMGVVVPVEQLPGPPHFETPDLATASRYNTF